MFLHFASEIFVPLLFASLAQRQKYLRKKAKVLQVKEKFHAYGLCPFFPHTNGMPINNLNGTISKVTEKQSCSENKTNTQISALKRLVNIASSLSITETVKILNAIRKMINE